MPDELKNPAQTTEIPGQPAKPVEEPAKGKVGDGSAEPPKEGEGKPEPKKQSPDQNAEFARLRREKERKEELDKRELETAIKVTGGVNPYTKEKIEDQTDLEQLYLMREIEAKGGDPIADYAKHEKAKRKEDLEKGKKAKMTEDQTREDWAKFSAAHPEIKLEDLMADEDFLDYADGKIGNKPLAQIYDNYLAKWKKTPEKQETPKTVKTSPGSLGTPSPQSSEYFTKTETEKLTKDPAALRKLSNADYLKVKKSAEYWAKH